MTRVKHTSTTVNIPKRHSDYCGLDSHSIVVRVTAQTLEQLRSLAHKEETNVSTLVRRALRVFLSRQKQQK